MPRLFPHQPPPIRVLIVEDHDGYAETLSAMLSGNPRLLVVGRAVDGIDGIERARALRPDVVVMDVNMPRLDGFAAAYTIRRELPESRIVLVTGAPRHDYATRAREAGADVFLPKDVDFGTLSDVVEDDREDRRRAAFSVAAATA